MTLCAVTVALPVYAQPIEQSVSVQIELESTSVSRVDVVIANNSDKDICYDLGHGLRAFEIMRGGKKVPHKTNLPFVSLKDRCLPIAGGETHNDQYDLSRGFSYVQRGDRVCFEARVKWQDDKKATNTPIISCVIVE